MGRLEGVIDSWTNAFLPDREALWDATLAAQGVPIKVRRDPEDAFCEPERMLARMDEIGVATLVLPTCDLPPHAGLTDYESFAMRLEEVEPLATKWPGRFVAQWSIDPRTGSAGLDRAREIVQRDWVVALHTHTHSFDLRFDAPEYYAYYALAHETGLPFVMQAGTSGGRFPSACGQPIGIDRPAIFFPEVDFLLSHTGWPWVEEAIAMALKFSNVHLGTASLPPKRWHAALVDFVRGPGRRKTLFGTSFPTVGHRHALAQLPALELDDDVAKDLMGGNARRLFRRLAELG
ncbi:MAG: amidohydrolase family protein [Myxococcota bacterium]|nr:amidohydrolase family protein [Myxococcales bacterium]